MKLFTSLLLFLVLSVSSAFAGSGEIPYAIAFTQEVMAIDPYGTPYPAVVIDPSRMTGVQSHEFDLGAGRKLRIETNVSGAASRQLAEVAGIINRTYGYIEGVSGRPLKKGILLYLLEFDAIPLSYKFEATFQDDSEWSEVRMAMLQKGESLIGPNGSRDLADLLYDTIPHELGHDILADIPAIKHDIDNRPTFSTRWFIDGVCELLAKGFASQEAPHFLGRSLRIRNVGSVLANPQVRDEVFQWAQNNNLPMDLESDLYGASMLLLMAWTESVNLKTLLDHVDHPSRAYCGPDLMAIMESTTGLDPEQVCNRAQQLGTQLNNATYVAEKVLLTSWGG